MSLIESGIELRQNDPLTQEVRSGTVLPFPTNPDQPATPHPTVPPEEPAEQPAAARAGERNRGWFTKPAEVVASYQTGSSKDWNFFDIAKALTDSAVKGGESGQSITSGGGNRASSEAVDTSSGHSWGRASERVLRGGLGIAEVDKPDTRPKPIAPKPSVPGYPGRPSIEGRMGEVPGTVNTAGNLLAGVEVQLRPVDAQSKVRLHGRAGVRPSGKSRGH